MIPVPEFIKFDNETCTYEVKVKSYIGCVKLDVNPFIKFMNTYSYLFGVVLIVIGFIVGVFGKPLFKPTVCVVGTLVFLNITTLFLFTLFFSRDTKEYVFWIVWSVCFILGGLFGLIMAKVSRLGMGVLAGWGGFCLGLILYSAFMYKLDDDRMIVYWCFNIGIAIIAGILSIIVFNHALIISTAIVGTYSFVRGISMYAGGFPNEMEIVNMI